MGIQITGYNEMYSNYRQASIPKVSEQTLLEQQKQAEQSKRLPEQVVIPQEQPARINNASLEDISLTLKVDDFDLVGKDSNIETLDMQKAVSNMQKDQVLQEYNYFVGSVNDISLSDSAEDGIMIQKF